MDFDIQRVAELAKIHLKPEEAKKLEKDLESILDYVRQLESLKTDGVEATSHVLNLENVFRADQVKPSQTRDEALRYAPSKEGAFFKVPKVVERD